MTDISAEIKFKTARSGGKGGQNVNKVETMVEGYWHVDQSALFTADQKNLITEKDTVVYVGGNFGVGGGTSFIEIASVEQMAHAKMKS